MSEIYESTALTFQLPSPEAQAYAVNLYQQIRNAFDRFDQDSSISDVAISLSKLADIPEEFRQEIIMQGWHFSAEASYQNGLYVAVGDGCDFADAVGAFIQHLLAKFDPTGFVQFEWSRTCSRPEPTCFSGGAAHITADEVRLFTTLDWLKERAESEAGKRIDRTTTDW